MAHILKALVGESSTTTGTGALTLAAALIDHRRFSAVCSVADTVEYVIRHATDGSWEAGIGTYSSANTLTRTTVFESSTGTAISFAAGDKSVIITPLASGLGRSDYMESKTTPVDADSVALSDSAASGFRKKLTWANLKATLKTYFDSLYLPATNPSITGSITEDVFAITDGASVDINPANGTIQTWTLTASRTPVSPTNFAAGQSVTLMIQDGTAYTITWSSVAVTWVGGSAPTLDTTKYTIVELWKVGSVIYGASPGAA